MLKRILIVATPMHDEWGNLETIDVTCFADRGEGFKLCSGIRIPTDSEHLSKFDMKMDVNCSTLAEFEFNSEFGNPDFTLDKAGEVSVDHVLNVVGQPMQYVFY